MTFAQPVMVGLDSQKYEGFFFKVASTLYIYTHSINEKEEEEEDIGWSNSDSKRVICKLNFLNVATENYIYKKMRIS